MSRTEAAQLAQDLPNNPAELLKLMELRRTEVEALIRDGSFGMVYVPTMMAKDVALALEDHGSELTDRQRVSLTSAVRRLVVASWRLDQYGDLGDARQITQAYTLFAAAAAEIEERLCRTPLDLSTRRVSGWPPSGPRSSWSRSVTPGTEAHKVITSPYNYNDHVFPILRDRCGRCHFPDGPAPMSLLTYKDALPWAESMREQLVGERMPTWFADPWGPGVKGGHSLTPRELDMRRHVGDRRHAARRSQPEAPARPGPSAVAVRRSRPRHQDGRGTHRARRHDGGAQRVRTAHGSDGNEVGEGCRPPFRE